MSKRPDVLSLYEPKLQSDSVSIIRIPSELGSDARGLAATPRHLLDRGLEKKIAGLGATVSVSDIICPQPLGVALGSRTKNLNEVAAVAEVTSAAVRRAAARDEFALALGGDHSIAIGTISGASLALREAGRSLGVIWIDAHPDANTPETTLSGNIHGMPVAALMGYGNPALTSIGGREPKIRPEQLLYIGLKDLDQAEIDFIRRHKIAAITMHDIVAHALRRVFEAIDELSQKVDRVWVSMDIDSIDEAYSPGVAMNSIGGLTRREVVAIANCIGKTCRLSGMDLVEMVPEKDTEGATTKLVFELIANFLGMNEGSYAAYMEKYQQAESISTPEASKPGAGARDRT